MSIGIDVGGTKIAAGLVRIDTGEILFRRTTPSLPERGGKAVLDDVLRMARELHDASGSLFIPQSMGIGLCELVDLSGRPMSAHSIDWRDPEIQGSLHNFLPTVIEADVRAAALAEARFGAGKGASSFLFVTVGTGISSCLVVGGVPYRGCRGATGTIASSPMHRAALPDDGDSTTLEDIASGPGMVRRFRRMGGLADSGEELMSAAMTGDARATSVVTQGGEHLGAAIGHLVNTLDPECVVLGGGVGSVTGLFWEILVASARRQIWWDQHRNLPMTRALLGPDAGLIGAAIAAT